MTANLRPVALIAFLFAASPAACGGDSKGSDASPTANAADSGTTQEAADGLDAHAVEETGADVESPDSDVADTAADSSSLEDGDSAADTSVSPGEDTVEVGGSCQDSVECKGDAECVSGAGGTPPHCAPTCASNADCVDTVKGHCGMCQSAGSFSFCVFVCGALAPSFVPECTITPACPSGPLTCDGVFCG